jgi:hypothetical protein
LFTRREHAGHAHQLRANLASLSLVMISALCVTCRPEALRLLERADGCIEAVTVGDWTAAQPGSTDEFAGRSGS